MKYNPQKIEKKWQKKWADKKLYKTKDFLKKPKFYCLDMFPYPSSEGLHVGHPKGYIATDITARFKILQGYNVFHPMGWDGFGLPAENYALKHKIHPRKAVEQNIKKFKKQLKKIGFTYDWSREIDTTDPNYYRWTQWMFLQMFKKGLAYESHEPINWCPNCKTGLANEDLEDGRCERCGSEIEQKPIRQWVLKMTAYAERLLNDLDKLPEWEDQIKEMQRSWIGKSEGVEFEMTIKNSKEKIKVYTTRIDTVFGMTYVAIAPEHPLIKKLKDKIENYQEVEEYLIKAGNKSCLERTSRKEKTGVWLKSVKAINPFNNQEIPLLAADYVLANYGTGAVMAVPAHDERDFEFAKKYNLPIIKVILPPKLHSWPHNAKSVAAGARQDIRVNSDCFVLDGELVNSGEFSGLSSMEAREKMTDWLIKNKIGLKKINYKMRDWVFSRQRYWGEPIPVIHCEQCGIVPVLEKDLPVKLPDIKKYEPTGTGESPLANIKEWVNVKCPQCGGLGKRETNTMPQWAGSCWYYLRYLDPKNKKCFVDATKEKYWMPVDLYIGGAEHAARHLLYARFWHKFLYDIKVVSTEEPFVKFFHVGLVNAEDGRKMSKRWGNTISPDEMIAQYGADSLRLYEMFMGPFNQAVNWNTQGLIGMNRFLGRVWIVTSQACKKLKATEKESKIIHKTIKKVTEDIEDLKFNTAISALMECFNERDFIPKLNDAGKFEENEFNQKAVENFIILLSPFAPHLAEELWELLGHRQSIFLAKWPKFDEKLIREETFQLVIQINGKIKDRIEVSKDISKEEAKKISLAREKIKKQLDGKQLKKVIYVNGKLINLVI